MIEVTMRVPRMTPGMISNTLAFSEPHWSAAKELIRELEALGWTFVRMTGATFAGAMEPVVSPLAAKPPFDPLTAGWVTCPRCNGCGWKGPHNIGPTPHHLCPGCDGLGIVVGPPRDGIKLVEQVSGRILSPIHPMSLAMDDIRRANAVR